MKLDGAEMCGGVFAMTREEAALIYMDVLIGFGTSYSVYQKAASILCETDKEMLKNAVSGGLKSNAYRREQCFF